jgi:hypothetical protein
MGIFTATSWKNVVSKFAKKKSGDRWTKKQLKNKLDVLKKEYSIFSLYRVQKLCYWSWMGCRKNCWLPAGMVGWTPCCKYCTVIVHIFFHAICCSVSC